MIKYKISVPKNLEKTLEKTPVLEVFLNKTAGLLFGTTAQVFCCQFHKLLTIERMPQKHGSKSKELVYLLY